MVKPSRLMRWVVWNTSRTISGLSPSEGSSISRMLGRDISARPMATICCSPPLKVPASCVARSLSLGNREYTHSRDSAVLDRALST